MASVGIVGAGLAGISAARAAEQDGFDVTVFDRGRRIGGRCSSQPTPLGYDYGAQFVTASDPRFVETLARLETTGDVAAWHGRFVDCTGGGCVSQTTLQRYVGVPSMSRLVEALADPLNILTHTRIATANESARGWQLWDSDDSDLGEYDALVLAMPPEQARALVPLKSNLLTALSEFRSVPCWAAMLSCEAPLPLAFDGARFDRLDVMQAWRDSSKPGREPGERWVLHAAAAWSRERFAADPKTVGAELVDAFLEAAAIESPSCLTVSMHRWGLARVEHGPRPVSLWDEDIRLAICGDWCVAPNLEGAWLSGLDAAARISVNIRRPRRRQPLASSSETVNSA